MSVEVSLSTLMNPFGLGVIVAAFAAPGAVALAAAPSGQGYKLVHADEFNGAALDTMKWGYNYSWSNTHNHAAYMTESQVKVGGGVLNLQAIKQRHPNARDFWHPQFGWQPMNYTSGAIHSSGTFRAKTGYFEASMKMSSTLGVWPAFWMLQDGWPPEIDIMEFPRSASNSDNQYWANYHYTNAANANASYGWQNNAPNLTTGFNTFGLEWTATQLKFYLNGQAIRTVNDPNAIADAQNMYLILNHAVGGWGGTPDPAMTSADFLTDWVRVYQKPTDANASIAWTGTAATAGWDSGANWATSVPKFQDQTAAFGTNANAAVNVTWNNSKAIGGLAFDGTTAYTIGSTGGLLMANSSGTAAITMAATTRAPQVVRARVEAYNNIAVTNNSAETLTFAGVIMGDGGVTFEGPGTTVITNNNTYAGNTFIDSGTQGPATVRVDRSRPFGTGTVVFNTAGNNTSGRIEILGNREVPNPITLSGRNNGTVALQNIADNNTFSGTISAQPGGGQYLIQSDAGQLELSGAAAGANGVALRAGAAGNRTFTLQGVGNGRVSGQVANGSGVVAITKAGAGTWTLSGNNDYTGVTTIQDGTLRLSTAAQSPVLTNAGGADLRGGKLVFDYTGGVSPVDTIRDILNTGRSGNFASGRIRSSTATDIQGLGYGDDEASAVTVMYTVYGDATLDGRVNFNDFLVLQSNFLKRDTRFDEGDFNYDSVTNFNDFLILQSNFGKQLGGGAVNVSTEQMAALQAFAESAGVPEPASLALLAAGALVLRRRRGR